MNQIQILILLLFTSFQITSQSSPYEVKMEPITIPTLGGIQSYAVGTHKDEWLIIGGRLDGLHRRQPFASFSADGNNEDIIVINSETKQVWRQSVTELSTNLREQLSSTNIQFYQDGEHLLLTGGYAYSPSNDDHITFPFLTVLNIENVIQNVKSGTVSDSDFIQIQDETFRVTGGRLAKIEDTYFLVGGHSFMGRYNPIGPEHGPGFEQKYTNEIRKFKLTNKEDPELEVLPPIHDEMHLHRRDYNLVPIISNADYGLMAYSGVFQNNADLPWLYPVFINENSYNEITEFTQYFNHYHCATLPIYDASTEEMNTLFFGGIAQFYEDNGVLVQDNDVPFVNTIANIALSKNGELTETRLESSMPGYLGAGSEFILSHGTQLYADGIVSGAFIGDEFTDVGYIFGGIRSSLPNIFWINTGNESEASSTIYKVSLRKRKNTSASQDSNQKGKIFFYPNPAQKHVRMAIELDIPTEIKVNIFDIEGAKVHSQIIPSSNVQTGKNYLVLDNVNIGYGAFFYQIEFGTHKVTRKVIWTE